MTDRHVWNSEDFITFQLAAVDYDYVSRTKSLMTLRQCRSRAGVLGNLMSEASERRRGHLTVHSVTQKVQFTHFS